MGIVVGMVISWIWMDCWWMASNNHLKRLIGKMTCEDLKQLQAKIAEEIENDSKSKKS